MSLESPLGLGWNPFLPPAPFTEVPFPQDRIGLIMPIIATPQFRVQTLPHSDSVVNRKTTTVAEPPSVACGFQPGDLNH